MGVKRQGFLGLVIGLVCLAGGCTPAGPGDATPDGGDSSPVAVVSADGSPTPTVSESAQPHELPQASRTTVIDPPPPLAAYATYLDGPGEDAADKAKRVERNDNIQNAIAECMAAQGFRYVPNPLNPDLSGGSTRVSPTLLTLPVPFLAASRDTVVRDGYGVMGTPEERAAAAGVVNDPNVAYQATLSSEEADAYSVALYGDPNAAVPTSESACSGKALARFPEPSQPDRVRAFEAEFWDLIYSTVSFVRDEVPQDPRVVQLDQEWESCMNTAGYVFGDGPRVENGPILAMGRAMRTRPDGTVGPVRNGVPSAEVPPEEKSLLGTAPERAVAVADFDCRVATNYIARLTDIRAARDKEYIAANQAALNKLVAAAESW
jgi:hypothetical protein